MGPLGKLSLHITLCVRAIGAGTSGTIYIDDFESRRLSYIGMLPDPEPVDQASWDENIYTYQPSRPHAVTDVDRPGSDTTILSYDANGTMTCRPHRCVYWYGGFGFASPQRERNFGSGRSLL